MQKEKLKELRVFAEEIRVETLKTIGSLGFGHVGGSMSVVETLAVLYGAVMKVDPKNPRWEDRDWCVMSKGHAGPAMYATLGLKGFYPVTDAYTLNQPHTNFPSHTDRTKTPGRWTAKTTIHSYLLATAKLTKDRSGKVHSSRRTISSAT